MRKLGKTVYEIAKSAAVTPITVATYLKKYNQFQAFDESRYILYKGFLGESIVKQVLETDGLNYQSQRVLTNRKKPDFLIDGKYFVEVKSQFLSYESFCEIVEKYLSAKEIKGGIIVAFYGYSKEILQTTKKYNISILNGKDIRNYFMSVDRFDLAKSVKDFLDLNYSKWKHMLPVVQKDAKYQKQSGISESKIFKEF